MNLANRITLLRLLLIPVILGLIVSCTSEREWLRYVAGGLYIVAAVSDIFDGYVARRYDQKTLLGAVFDPLADKLLINLSLIFMAVNEQFSELVPMWLPVLVLGRDVVITGGAYLLNRYFGPLRPRPRILGKITTVFQSVATIGVLLGVFFAYHLVMVMVALCVISLIDYFYKGMEKVTHEAA